MFAFEIWGRFAAFRDPFTISQNITLPIPPKTTVAGMMASILGVENYFADSAFTTFEYSVITLGSASKKSFSQNYINDYTSKVQTHINSLKKLEYEKISTGLRDGKSPQKPINRELLLNPKYVIIIKDFAYEEKIMHHLKERISIFPFYLGNSEFAGNFKFIEITNFTNEDAAQAKVDSFILESDLENITFEEGIRYSTITFATTLNQERTPLALSSVVIGSKPISIKNLTIAKITCQDNTYRCRFL